MYTENEGARWLPDVPLVQEEAGQSRAPVWEDQGQKLRLVRPRLCHCTYSGHLPPSLSFPVCQDLTRQVGRSVGALGVPEPWHPTERPLNCKQAERVSSEVRGKLGN